MPDVRDVVVSIEIAASFVVKEILPFTAHNLQRVAIQRSGSSE
jgi:hypothetical protein